MKSKKTLPSFTVRRLKPEDAVEVSKCAELTYGRAYENFIYDPGRIRSMNETGEMLSLVAVSSDGEFMGHIAAKREPPESPIAELGVLLVAPAFRSRGVGDRMAHEIIAAVRASGVRSAYVRAVAGHTISQHMSLEYGQKPCAILLGTFPRDVEFKELAGPIPDKMSGLVLWMPMIPAEPRRLFIPERHREWIERIYRILEVPWNETGAGRPALEKGNHLKSRFAEILNIGEVEIPRCDQGALNEAGRAIRELCLKGAEAVYLYVTLEDPGAPELADALEGFGCFFAGLIPDRISGRDALVLQNLNNLAINYQNIRLEDPASRELLAYIESQDPLKNDRA